MPFQFNEARRHRIPKARHRVRKPARRRSWLCKALRYPHLVVEGSDRRLARGGQDDARRPTPVLHRTHAAAAQALRSGVSVVADAVFDKAEDRAAIADAARRVGAPFHGVWLDAPRDTLLGRIQARVSDPSDATADILDSQLQRKGGTPDWTRIDARGDRADVAASILAEAMRRRRDGLSNAHS